MEQMLDLRNSKCYKIGEKDLVTRDNDFEMATGNANGVMGYDSINSPITAYCSKPQKIMFILQKDEAESTYSKLFFEIKKGLFLEEKEFFAEKLKTLISI